MPHCPQNLCEAGFSAPQLSQLRVIEAPQQLQISQRQDYPFRKRDTAWMIIFVGLNFVVTENVGLGDFTMGPPRIETATRL
jgi:hypothetical protein